MKTKKKQLSLYIHIPFCKKKCLYCDFLSAPVCAQERESYVKALLREISLMAESCIDYEVISVFFGGGTPSLLSKNQMKRIMSVIKKGYCLMQDAEITMECNPATADFDKLSFFKDCGVNRLSIGLQSANDAELKELGRIHSFEQFLDTFRAARKAGFSNINIDIMSALPGQTYESYEDTLHKVTALHPEHISAYSLIIEEGTPFYERYGTAALPDDNIKNEGAQTIECAPMYPSLPDEDTERKMYHKTKSILKNEGYNRYEISNYAKKGYECRHNLTYWTGVEYLGLGIGAASYLKGYRFKNSSDMQNYISLFCEIGAGILPPRFTNLKEGMFHVLHEEVQKLSLEEEMEEYMFLGLRLKKGVSISGFKKRFGKTLDEVYGTIVNQLKKEQLLLQKDNRYFLSQRGTDVANYVMMQFLIE